MFQLPIPSTFHPHCLSKIRWTYFKNCCGIRMCPILFFFRVLESEFAFKYARIDGILSFAEWWKLKYPISNYSVKYHVKCTCVDFVAALPIPLRRWGWNQGIKLDIEMKEGFVSTMEKVSCCMKANDFAWKSCKQNKSSAGLMNPLVVFTSLYYKLVYSPFCCDKILI